MTPEQITALARDIDFAIDVTEPREVLLRRFEDAIRAALSAPARPTPEQIALVEGMREQLNEDASTLEFQVAQCGEDTGLLDQSFGMRRDADALTALLTAVTGKDTL